MNMLSEQGNSYTGAEFARRKVELANPRDPDSRGGGASVNGVLLTQV